MLTISRMMNTKYNSTATGPVPRALGRPVGVLPLGPRSAAGHSQKRAGSIERRPLQRNASTGSIGSARSVLSNASESSLTSEKNINASNRRYRKSDITPTSQNSGRKLKQLDPGIPPLNESRKPKAPNPSETASSGIKRHQKQNESPASTNQRKGRVNFSKRVSPQSDFDEEFDCEGQDVKFFDIPSASRSSTSQSTRTNTEHCDRKNLTVQDILDISQETEPYKVYDVDLHGEGLTSAPDLEKFRKLRVLNLSGNHIKNITGLDFNWDLRELKLYDNEIASIEGLTNLKELSHLQLQHNQISKIGRGLGSLKKLQTLRLDNNKLTKIETPELLSCSHITTLDLSSNRLETLAPLNYLPNLEELLASGNRLKSTGDLSKCRKLQELDLSWNQLADLAGIANLPNLQILDLSHNNITSLKPVGRLRSVEELNLNANRISELSSFSSVFPKLQILFVCDNMIKDWNEICSLEGLRDLVELSVTANPFTMEDGDMPAYMTAVSVALPCLEVIDGAQIKRAGNKPGKAPLMRPMSAASVISVRQIDSQLKAAANEQEDFHKSIADKFASLRSIVDSLPSQPPRPSSGYSMISSRCSSRSRIREARDFAAYNFDDGGDEDL
ncbi:hypothetical protein EGW08_004847 [Elysia chlorotica]|uniref:Protein phosphatase 1 regulatory subunit 7 n=1 Tax=Elysia chlorotica TaxID=188477 RepID=A0A3S0ZW09_ELYCH|nr:hypothetical protein EGW08_004847 [Elysia chlorotica]